MDIKEEIKGESSFPDFCSEDDRELSIQDLVKKVKIETVTTSSDIKAELEDSTCSQNEEHHVLRFNETINESEIETKIDIKEEWWLEREDSYINDDIKDETREHFDFTKPPRLVPGIKNSNIRSSNYFEMDTKLKIEEEESLPDDVTPQNETKFFRKVVTMRRSSDSVLLDDHCNVPIKTEIKSEAPFTKHLVKRIKSEAVIYNWEIDRKGVIDEQTLISDFGLQSEGELLSKDPVTKLGKFNTGHEMGNKLEIKEEPLWPETDTSDTCDDIEDGYFPPVKSSRLGTHGVSCAVSGQSLLIAAEVSGRGTSFSPGKDNPEYELQKSDDTQIPSAKTGVLSEQSRPCREKKDMYIGPLNLKQKTLTHQHKRPHKYETSDKSCLADLKTHSLIHEGKKPHQCKTCDKSFTQLANLKTHSLIHEGKKPHKCKSCDKSFTQSSSLRTHNLIHEGKKPHKCKTCDKSFARLGDLKTHCLIHEGKRPHQCKTCNKSFTQLGNLIRHSLIHEGTKPHQCKTCNKSFTLRSALITHYLIHEGKKPHKCNTCNKSFRTLSHLKRHYSIHEIK